MLQLKSPLVDGLRWRGLPGRRRDERHALGPEVDWLTVSPKMRAPLKVTRGSELKLVYPQGNDPAEYADLDFRHFYLQPMDGPALAENTAAAIDYCKANPRWRLSVQMHKTVGIA
jgi:7-carboxy-7-deazaguanine synthase